MTGSLYHSMATSTSALPAHATKIRAARREVFEAQAHSKAPLLKMPNAILDIIAGALTGGCFLALASASPSLARCEAFSHELVEDLGRQPPKQWSGSLQKRNQPRLVRKVRNWVGWFPTTSSFEMFRRRIHVPSLQNLHLVASTREIASAAGVIAGLMPQLHRLQVLGLQVPKIAWHILCDGWVTQLSAALEEYAPPLHRLTLPGINVTRPACNALGRAIAANSSIRLVELHDAQITPRGWQELVGAVASRRSSLPLPRIVWAAVLDRELLQELERRGLHTVAAGGSWELSRKPLQLDLAADCALNQLLTALKTGRTVPMASDKLAQLRREPQEPQEPQTTREWKVILKPPRVSVAHIFINKLEEGVKDKKPEVALAATKELEDWGRRCDADSGNQVAETVARKLRYALIVSVRNGQVSLAEAAVRALQPFVQRFENAKLTGEMAMQRLVYLVDDSIQKGNYSVVVAAASALLEFRDFPGMNVSHATFGLLSVLRESLLSGQAADAKMAIGAIQKFAKGSKGRPSNGRVADESTIHHKTAPCQSAQQVVDALLMTIEDSLKLDGGSVAEAAASVLLEMMARCVPILHETVASKLMAIWKHQSMKGEAQELNVLLLRIARGMSSMMSTGCTRMR